MSDNPIDRRDHHDPERGNDDMIDRIRAFPEIDAPAGLSERIMATLQPRRRPWWQILLQRFARPRTITIRPLTWAPLGAAAVVLMIVFTLNRAPEQSAPLPHQTLAQVSADAETHYQLGRQLLSDHQAQEALVHLRRAAHDQPDHALYQFWVGVNYWALDDMDQERAHYQTALQLDPDLLPAHVYIGHNYLDRGEWEKALDHYQRVLQDEPYHSEALFNTGLALRQQGRTMLENDAWKAYLDHYDRGERAIQAVEFLNTNGDFSFRRIQLGPLRIVKRSLYFTEGSTLSDEAARNTLDDVGHVVARNRKLQMHVVAYVENNETLAKLRAKSIKQYLKNQFAGLAPQRIKPSWFGVAETVLLDDRTYQLHDSIRIFATVINES